MGQATQDTDPTPQRGERPSTAQGRNAPRQALNPPRPEPRMESPAGPVFVLPVRVYYEDTDAGGVVYYANYLRYIERARTEWLRRLGFEQWRLHRDHGVLFAVRRIEAGFERAARLDDALEVTLRVDAFSPVRMLFHQTAVRAAAPQVALFTAQVEVACIDAERFVPKRIPQAVQEAVKRWMST